MSVRASPDRMRSGGPWCEEWICNVLAFLEVVKVGDEAKLVQVGPQGHALRS